MTGSDFIELTGVRTHNLKSISVQFPLGQMTVVTGVSGSGKSSLVFDTLYGEAYRRYVESLSSYARQYLKALPKPEISSVVNLPPAIAVKQNRSQANSRSTVGTMTELNDLLRMMYTHRGEVFCTNCNIKVRKDNGAHMAAVMLEECRDGRALLLAPLTLWGKVAPKELKAQLTAQGFTRMLVKDEVRMLEDMKLNELAQAAVVVDRLSVKSENKARLIDSSTLALRVGRGRAWFKPETGESRFFSTNFECAKCLTQYVEPSLALLSFNHPLGACQNCQGFGMASEINYEKVIPDHALSLKDKGVAAWNWGSHTECYGWAQKSAKKLGIRWDKPFEDYTAKDWQWLKEGDGTSFSSGGYTGIKGYFAWLDSKRYKPHYRIHASRYRHYQLCQVCQGQRLNPKALAVKLVNKSLADASHLTLEALAEWIEELAGTLKTGAPADQRNDHIGLMGIGEAIEEARARLRYLLKIGVGYLTVDRSARTLSGGELQRINMARCLGSALTETLFCLDEPTSGLHPRDSHNLLEIMYELRNQGNSVVVVEHERGIIQGADHLIEIGPQAGHQGGHVIHAGAPKAWQPVRNSKMVAGTVAPAAKAPPTRSADDFDFFEIKGVSTHNLKNVSVQFPVGALTAVCGVSGSGKTSLIQHSLFPLLAKALGQDIERSSHEVVAKSVGPLPLIKKHAEVMLVSQASLGRSSRSNITTYIGVYDEIRKLFASTPLAQKSKLTPGSFSFNTPGGRCETCSGLGTVVEDLSFLGEMSITCPLCQGKRFTEKVLAVTYRDKSLLDVLAMTIDEARAFFFDRAAIAEPLEIVRRMGLGYVTLGQSTSSFSGGEAQRLKLTSVMMNADGGKPSILILDEPTTGLADSDVQSLIGQLRILTERGHTIIVVEHHVAMLAQADWLIEIGPEAAHRGGELIFQGIPKDIQKIARSVTASYLGKEGTA